MAVPTCNTRLEERIKYIIEYSTLPEATFDVRCKCAELLSAIAANDEPMKVKINTSLHARC